MPTYKLIYFQGRGRGEITRFIFKQAGIDFEDVRVSFGDDWKELKPKTPYGTLPVLEVDGKQLAGSIIIQRYLAEEFGLAGSNPWENAQMEGLIGVGVDFIHDYVKTFYEKDEARKAELKKKFDDELIPKYFGIFEKLLISNGTGWIFGSKVSYVDLAVYNHVDVVNRVTPEALDKYPNVKKHHDVVAALPNIAKWLKERPETHF